MNDKERFKIMKAGIEMYESLINSVQKVGGKGFSIEDLEKMSSIQLIVYLATNDIRFVVQENNRISRALKYIQSIINEGTSSQSTVIVTTDNLLNIKTILSGSPNDRREIR